MRVLPYARALVALCSLAAATTWWKREACHDGGESVSLSSPGLGAFTPDTTEDFDRWAAATGLLGFAVPAWRTFHRANAAAIAFIAVASWVTFHAGATSLSGITCEAHDATGPKLAYGPGLFAAYGAAVFVSVAVSMAN